MDRERKKVSAGREEGDAGGWVRKKKGLDGVRGQGSTTLCVTVGRHVFDLRTGTIVHPKVCFPAAGFRSGVCVWPRIW